VSRDWERDVWVEEVEVEMEVVGLRWSGLDGGGD
jgi:hypothetical protein